MMRKPSQKLAGLVHASSAEIAIKFRRTLTWESSEPCAPAYSLRTKQKGDDPSTVALKPAELQFRATNNQQSAIASISNRQSPIASIRNQQFTRLR